ncbi:MAG: DoxX family protein [Patescibacteria group bacterium]|nr:DoxX family protein [Patescibacteria group bacterium]MDE2116277.1 DoxX family protein [Patescibacteria group bacterium]
MRNLRLFAPVVLRIGIALVFLWFGYDQFRDPSAWTAYVPQFAVTISMLSATTLVHINAAFELIFGAALMLGFFTRFVAFFLTLHMFDIMFIVGWDAVGVRDFGLSIATTAIWLFGPDWFSLDRFFKEKAPSL